jgi:hypothetical protein
MIVYGGRRKTQRRTFSKSDYGSGNGMMTSVWGPAAWHLLHTISFNYPVHPTHDDKRHYREFILSFGKVLPCGKCRENFKNTLERMPVTNDVMSSRECFSKFIYRLHNDVNARLKKTRPNPTYCNVRDQYEVFRARCGKTGSSNAKHTTRTSKRVGQGRSGLTKEPEKGCTEPLRGIKTKCLIRIVPKEYRASTFRVHPSCSCRRGQGRGRKTRRAH